MKGIKKPSKPWHWICPKCNHGQAEAKLEEWKCHSCGHKMTPSK